MKTNAVRTLDRLGMAYQLKNYSVDPNDLSATSTAKKIRLSTEQVFKTLVTRGVRSGVCLAVIPSHTQLDLKAMARLTQDRKFETVALNEVQPLTGYIRGGVTALACKRNYPVYVDDSMETMNSIAVSAGVRGTMIILAPADYLRAVDGKLGAISKPMKPAES